jgi:hypothetical protein
VRPALSAHFFRDAGFRQLDQFGKRRAAGLTLSAFNCLNDPTRPKTRYKNVRQHRDNRQTHDGEQGVERVIGHMIFLRQPQTF